MDWITELLQRGMRVAMLDGLLERAADLMSDDGENPEYDRALVDLIAEACGTALPPGLQDMDAKKQYIVNKLAVVRAERS